MNAVSTFSKLSSTPKIGGGRRWVGRFLLGLLLLSLVLAGAGATIQTIADQRANLSYPPPGQLINVGEGTLQVRLHLNCLGEGSPTVVLETGGGGFGSLDFTNIQPGLAKITRVCAYDRAGYGWSDPSPEPRSSEEIVKELHTLLHRAGVAGPYVMGGMSLGGYFTRLFATRYPDEVAGMVLIDASPDDEWLNQEYLDGLKQFATVVKISQWASRVGLFRLGGATGLFRYPVLDYSPAEIARLAQPTTYRTDYYDMVYAEINPTRMQQNADEVRAARRPLGNLPLVVMWAGSEYSSEAAKEFWFVRQRGLLTLSTNSKAVVVEGANHISIAGAYAGDVIEAMRGVVESLRAGG